MTLPEYVAIRVRRPDDYEDIAAQLVVDDFLATRDSGNWLYDVADYEPEPHLR